MTSLAIRVLSGCQLFGCQLSGRLREKPTDNRQPITDNYFAIPRWFSSHA